MQGQPSIIIVKASMKDHTTSSFQSSKEKLGAISHIYRPKTSISSRIQNFWKGTLRIFPLYGQIQGEVIVGTKNGNNLGGSSYLCLFKTNMYYVYLILYDISLIIQNIFLYVNVSHFISYFILKDMPIIHKYHRSLTSFPYRSMDGGSFTKLII